MRYRLSGRNGPISPLIVILVASAHAADIKLNGNVIETARHKITLAASGLPEQIEILASQNELPLELRGGKAEVPVQVLSSMGRGKQLRDPIRVEVTVAGKTITAEPAASAKPVIKRGNVSCRSKLKAGAVDIALDLSYDSDGVISGTIDYGGKGEVESIVLTLDLLGAVDMALSGVPVTGKLQAYRASDYAVGSDEGLVWGNSAKDAKAQKRKPAPGPVTHMFVGSGDRGFTWLSKVGKGWDIEPKLSTSTLTRDKVGQVTWRILFVNHQTKLKGKRSIDFSLRIHPAGNRDAKHRSLAWLDWPFDGKTGEVLLVGLVKAKKAKLVRADAATVHESATQFAVLEGPAGGDALASAGTHAETYPINLFRYLAGTHTGLTVRLRSNARAMTKPGADPAPDRMLLGRALLCDIGLDANSLANLTGAARVLSALEKFGYFESDGKTEFIPFWRNNSVIRFGETFSKDDAFSLHEENPVGKVYVSVYRRPQARRGIQSMVVIVNETDKSVRDQLYVLNPKRIFGGANVLDHRTIKSTYDFSRFHVMSDWMKLGVVGKSAKVKALQDMEDQSIVRQNVAKDGIEVYGPQVHIPAHDFRILFGRNR